MKNWLWVLIIILILGALFYIKNIPQESPIKNCEDKCGDRICQEIVCLEINCPCAETKKTCTTDCGIPEEILKIANESDCAKEGFLTKNYSYNQNSDTWWIDLELKTNGCAPACVIYDKNKSIEINYRCTGLK